MKTNLAILGVGASVLFASWLYVARGTTEPNYVAHKGTGGNQRPEIVSQLNEIYGRIKKGEIDLDMASCLIAKTVRADELLGIGYDATGNDDLERAKTLIDKWLMYEYIETKDEVTYKRVKEFCNR